MTPRGATVLALDIGGTKLAAGVGGPDGSLTRRSDAPTRAEEGAAVVLDRAIALARDCYAQELAADGSVGAVGVSTMGLTEPAGVSLAPNVPGWEQLQIPAALETAFPGLPVVVGNDVKLATRAEMAWGSLRGVDDGIYLNLGTGIAAGIVANGRLLHGAHGAAGEVGYSVSGDLPGTRLAAEGGVPFEEFFGGAGVARRLAQTGRPASVAELVARQADDPGARDLLDELWNGIAMLAANLCIALDPSVLSLGGGYLREDSGVLERVQALVSRAVPSPPVVRRAAFGADASLRGAIAVGLGAIGGPA